MSIGTGSVSRGTHLLDVVDAQDRGDRKPSFVVGEVASKAVAAAKLHAQIGLQVKEANDEVADAPRMPAPPDCVRSSRVRPREPGIARA